MKLLTLPAFLYCVLFRDPHAGGGGGGGPEAVAPDQVQRGPRDPQTPQEQHEGAGASQGHPRDLPHQAAVHEGKETHTITLFLFI